jgi:hypothetical protein
MPIDTDDQAFAAICAALGIGDIVQLVGVSDDTIRSKCIPELAELLIELKRETQRQVARRLAGLAAKANAVLAKTNTRDDSLRCRLQRLNNA